MVGVSGRLFVNGEPHFQQKAPMSSTNPPDNAKSRALAQFKSQYGEFAGFMRAATAWAGIRERFRTSFSARPTDGDLREAEQAMIEAAQYAGATALLAQLSTQVTALTVNKWLVQVIDKKGRFYSAYFALPPKGMPAVLHDSVQSAMAEVLAKVQEAARAEPAEVAKNEAVP